MESTNKCKNVGFSAILWAFVAILLCVSTTALSITISTSGRIDDPPTDGIYTVTGSDTIVDLYANGSYLVYIESSATVNFMGGAKAGYVVALQGSYLNFFGGDVEVAVSVIEGALVTVYGTDFSDDDSDDIPYDVPWYTNDGVEILEGFYAGGNEIYLNFSSFTAINLIAPVDILIGQLVDDVKVLNLKQGISNSLDAKLQNALDALKAANAGQRQDAVNKIQAFINAVEAQSDKAIEEADAASLIDSAYLIISLL